MSRGSTVNSAQNLARKALGLRLERWPTRAFVASSAHLLPAKAKERRTHLGKGACVIARPFSLVAVLWLHCTTSARRGTGTRDGAAAKISPCHHRSKTLRRTKCPEHGGSHSHIFHRHGYNSVRGSFSWVCVHYAPTPPGGI